MDPDRTRQTLEALKGAIAQRDRRGVNDACRALIAWRAPLGRQWEAIAAVLQHNGEHVLAVRAAAIWLQQSGGTDDARFHHVAVLARAGQVGTAAGLARELNPRIPSTASYHFLRGTLAMNLGQPEEAREHLRKATRADNRAGQAWLALAMSGKIPAEDARAIADASGAMETAAPTERSAWFYALGKVQAERGEHDAAFHAFAGGAALMRALRSYDAARDAADAQQARSGWNNDSINDLARTSMAPRGPIFVTGLPRSGTTLVEQILASHSAVAGGEEIGVFRLLQMEIGGKSRASVAEYLARGGSVDAIRALYLHLVRQRFPGEQLFVDKTLNASRYLGLLAGFFPEAPIIWVRRDPLDCAWSAFRTWFLRGVDWSWSLQHIADHFRIENSLFEHWTKQLGSRLLLVAYEDLVRAPEQEIARICNHCGLLVEPRQLLPHRTQRVVTTASVTQVRTPINTKAIGSAGPYSRHLLPFLRAYHAT
jgi:hypothetical protein